MEETVLYRKMRPMTFERVIGQDLVVNALKNQIINNRISHAYLFFGIRGTGKTTVARIFARAINCENPKNGNPCNECPTCRRIIDGRTSLVIEWDGSTKGKVDDIRDIQEYVHNAPIDGKYRVFIIDEIQRMTKPASNAFLKTLEEPPRYAVFILATTDLKNIPSTITSRCQRYDFKRIPNKMIIEQLREISVSKGINVEENALKRIASLSEGSMRDALSLYDRVDAMVNSNSISLDETLEALGRVDTSIYAECVRNSLNGRAVSNVTLFNLSMDKGISEEQFLADFIWYLKNLYLYKTEGNAEEEAFSRKDYLVLSQIAGEITIEKLNYLIELLDKTINTALNSTSRRTLIEVALVQSAMPSMKDRISELQSKIDQRIAQLEGLQGDEKMLDTYKEQI